jgi:GNAT superfamily N-acetyltransferase
LSTHPLRMLLDNAAAGNFPPVDGLVEVVPSPGGPADALLALTGHFMLAADIDPEEFAARVPPRDLSLPMSPATLVWLEQRLGSIPTTLDALLCSPGNGGGLPEWLHEVDGHDHPRVDEAARYRRDLRVFVDDGESAVLALGRGVVDRWDFGFEVARDARGRGLGRRLVQAALDLVPRGETLWAQVAPGNAASVRAILASGFIPVGAEVLFPARR